MAGKYLPGRAIFRACGHGFCAIGACLIVLCSAANSATPHAAANTTAKSFDACVALLNDDPADAQDYATSWLHQGGGTPARRCKAQADLDLDLPAEAAAAFDALARDPAGCGKISGDVACRADLANEASRAWLLAGMTAQARDSANYGLSLLPPGNDAPAIALHLSRDRALLRMAQGQSASAQPAPLKPGPARSAPSPATSAHSPATQSTLTQPTLAHPTQAQPALAQSTPAQPGMSPPTPSPSTLAQPAPSASALSQSALADLATLPDAALPVDGLVLRANAERMTGQLDAANRDITMAFQREPENPAVLLERGILRERTDDTNGAQADWKKVIALAPDSLEADLARQDLDVLAADPDRAPDLADAHAGDPHADTRADAR